MTNLKNYVSDWAKNQSTINTILTEAYETQNFIGMGYLVMGLHKNLANKYPEVSPDPELIKDWYLSIDEEALPINSSGSFFTALNDTDFLEHLSEDAEEIDLLIELATGLLNN